jgi:hypothetical protein
VLVAAHDGINNADVHEVSRAREPSWIEIGTRL